MVKRVDGATYLFAVSLYHEETDATFDIRGLAARATAEVIDESRGIVVTNGSFTDHFGGRVRDMEPLSRRAASADSTGSFALSSANNS